MDPLSAYRRLTAAATGIAQPIATRRHYHASDEPLVVCCYHLSGDPGAPIGFLYGTDRTKPEIDVIGEPRNRELRFRGLERFARNINSYIGKFTSVTPIADRHGQPRLTHNGDPLVAALDAPQLLVPNVATAQWLGVLARSALWLRTDGDHPVDPELPLMARHLMHLSERRAIPGSSNLLSATEWLGMHWITGQTHFEDANVATMLSWVDPEWPRPSWFDGLEHPPLDHHAASRAELLPSAGPVPDPAWDKTELEPAIARFNAEDAGNEGVAHAQIRTLLATALTPAWTACWRSIDLLRQLPEANSVPSRWEADRRAWGMHAQRAATGRANFRRHRSMVQNARLLTLNEDVQAQFEVAVAFDDPLVMARHVAAGDAIEGEVVSLDRSNFVLGPTGHSRSRPIISITPDDEVLLPVGTEVVWADDARIRGEISRLPSTDGTLEVTVNAGMRSASMPNPGTRGIFSALIPPARYPETVPDEVPWTHGIPPSERGFEIA
jgi:hypothetical protein